jgi:hypothetical protein
MIKIFYRLWKSITYKQQYAGLLNEFGLKIYQKLFHPKRRMKRFFRRHFIDLSIFYY